MIGGIASGLPLDQNEISNSVPFSRVFAGTAPHFCKVLSAVRAQEHKHNKRFFPFAFSLLSDSQSPSILLNTPEMGS